MLRQLNAALASPPYPFFAASLPPKASTFITAELRNEVTFHDLRLRQAKLSPFLYYDAAETAEAAVMQFYEFADANGREATELVTVAVFNGNLTNSLSCNARRE